jgi:uncharacterized coiled-coil protein SlyX
MNDGLQSRLERLEVLYSEQDYTIQTLNTTISQQDREIAALTLALEQLRLQLQSLRSEVASDIDPGFEQPPHY